MKTEFVCLWFFVNAGCSEIVEHEIYGKEALQEADKLIPSNGKDIDPRCRKCSLKENLYCIGKNVLHDHCCCDRRHREKFSFIPHKCYVKLSGTCEPVASDCEEYTRLYNCCCKTITQNQWKRFSLAVAANKGAITKLSKVLSTLTIPIGSLKSFFFFLKTCFA